MANVGTDRVNTHEGEGWRRVGLWDTDAGAEAKRIERSVLRAWRDQWAPYGVDPKDMPKRGFTETAPIFAVSIPDTVALIESEVRQAS